MFKKISVFLLLLVSVFSVSSFDTHAAADRRLNMLCNQPIVDDNHGYILLECSSGSAVLLHWVDANHSSSSGVDTTDSFVSVRVNDNSVEFKCGANGSGFFGLYAYHQTNATRIGTENIECTVSYDNSYSYTFNWSDTFVAFTHGGEFQLVDNLGGWTHDNVIVTWGAETLILQQLSKIYESLAGVSANGSVTNQKYTEILNKINDIHASTDDLETILAKVRDVVYSYLSSMDVELKGIANDLDNLVQKYFPQILEEQKKTNTWLEKIFEHLNESAEKQKQEATNQGNSSVSQGTSSIEDKGAGFVNSMGGLVSSMSYSGTQCAWTFPQVKLPAIAGVMDEVVLIEEQPIDFTQWINAIPPHILLLIQSVLTIGLIVYCFKELYGTISYVLTLRGGGSDE